MAVFYHTIFSKLYLIPHVFLHQIIHYYVIIKKWQTAILKQQILLLYTYGRITQFLYSKLYVLVGYHIMWENTGGQKFWQMMHNLPKFSSLRLIILSMQ